MIEITVQCIFKKQNSFILRISSSRGLERYYFFSVYDLELITGIYHGVCV